LHEIADATTENDIEITHSSHIHLHDNNIEAGYYGILLTDVHNAEITGNQLHFSQEGLSARNSSNIFLKDNRFFDNNQHDISVSGKTEADTFRNDWHADNEFGKPPHPSPTTLIDLDASAKAADQGDLVAQLNLAFYWYREDDAKALFRFRQAAAQGHPKAQYHLGWLYYEGKGVSPNYSQAAHWFRQAAEQGYSSAQNVLGGLYYEGKGVLQDFPQAAYWARKAAQQGDAKAQNNLAGLYYNGKGVPQDCVLAALWVTKAAAQGYAQAQNNLGELYLQGQAVPLDIDQARQWFKKAAEQGNMKAQYNLNKFPNPKSQDFKAKF
jgi:parallel beta-helix repeat protein